MGRKVLDRSRKLVKIACRIVYKAKTRERQSTQQSLVTLTNRTNHPRNKQGIQAKKTSTKKPSFKKKYNIILQGTGIKVKYIKPHHQEKGEQC